MAIDPCTEYGLALAAEDFVPVLLAGAGTLVLALAAGRSLPSVRVPALLAGALVGVWRGRQAPWWPFLLLPAVGGIAAVAVRDTWPLLIVSAIGAVLVGVLALRLCLRGEDRVGALLFVVYIVGTLVLPPLAARPHQSEQLQWGEQSTNTLVQLSFLLGAVRLLRRTPASSSEPAPSVGAAA